MIVKPYERTQAHKDPRRRSGSAAERQMAHYLNRTFSGDESVFVLHGLRFEDRDQPEQDGSHGVCQIDHLVVHRWGLFVVESKSVTEEVRIASDGSGGDEWSSLASAYRRGGVVEGLRMLNHSKKRETLLACRPELEGP